MTDRYPAVLPILDPAVVGGDPPGRAAQAVERWPDAVLLRLGGVDLPTARRWLAAFLHDYPGRLVVNGGPWLGELAGKRVWGIHIPERNLGKDIHISSKYLFGVSTHSDGAIIAAAASGARWVSVSPVCRTASHPDVAPLPWQVASRRARLATRLGLVPYALGGLTADDLDRVRSIGFWGVMGIRGFW